MRARYPGRVTERAATVTLRPYEPRDRVACLTLFEGNAPPFFAPTERADYR